MPGLAASVSIGLLTVQLLLVRLGDGDGGDGLLLGLAGLELPPLLLGHVVLSGCPLLAHGVATFLAVVDSTVKMLGIVGVLGWLLGLHHGPLALGGRLVPDGGVDDDGVKAE